MIDTSIISMAMRKQHGVEARLKDIAKEYLATSVVVLAEGWAGAHKTLRADYWLDMWHKYLEGWQILPFDAICANHYARIRAHLEKNGCMIGLHDCQIAATALAHNLIMVTDNLDEFRRVPGLRVENWAK
jgi:tRNA(fMet)-specific endonuclease VapC